MFGAFFDDSGTHVGGGRGASPLVVVGGVVASTEQWDTLNQAWIQVLARERLPFFHLTKFKVAKDPPYVSMTEEHKTALLEELVSLISNNVTAVFSSGILRADYNAVLTQEEKDRYGDPYAMAAQLCWLLVRLWAEHEGHTDYIPFIVEKGTPNEAQLSKVFDNLEAEPVMKRLYRLDTLTPGIKQRYPGLQVADIVANSTYELADHYKAGGRVPSKWMDIVSPALKEIGYELIPDAKVLRDWTDDINGYYRLLGRI